MGEQELLGGLADLGLRGITVPAAGGEGAALERRSGPVEDEDGADAEEEELADAAEEPEEVGVADHLPAVVPHRPHELHHPDARVHRHPLPRKGLHRHAPPHRSQQLPQPVNSHLLPLSAGGRGLDGGYSRRSATRRGARRWRDAEQERRGPSLSGYDSPRPSRGFGRKRSKAGGSSLVQFGPSVWPI